MKLDEKFVLFFLILCTKQFMAQTTLPDYYTTDGDFDQQLKNVIKEVDLEGTFKTVDGPTTVSFALIDLNGTQPVFGGVHPDSFIYPASVYKMYVAMEVLHQISNGDYGLYDEKIISKTHNVVDSIKEIKSDPRPLIQEGDTLTINYLLDLMISRSDNTAANVLIDLTDRSNINKTMKKQGWDGSQVTRKFLLRAHEDTKYKNAEDTETSALDAADFIYKMYKNELINPWVSLKLKNYLGAQLDKTKLAAGLPDDALFYHKTGWWNMFINDVGIVDDGETQYIIAIFTPLPEEKAQPKLKKLAESVHQLMKSRNSK